MKNRIILSLALCTAQITHAIPHEEVLDELQQTKHSVKTAESNSEKSISSVKSVGSSKRIHRKIANDASEASPHIGGNLPSYAIRTQSVTEFGTPTIIPKNEDFDSLVELRKGDTLRAVIAQDLVAYPGSKAPVIARVLDGKFKGAIILGEASMDPTTKRANVSFSTIRPFKSKASYAFNGELMASDGIRGLDGEYESSYWTYFWAETLTNAVAGIADASTQKTATAMGGYVTTPGVNNQIQQGTAIGLSRTAERLGDRVKTAPEITTVKGPIIVQITVLK